jgi:hypothetical protein
MQGASRLFIENFVYSEDENSQMIEIVLFLACGPICAWLEGID